MHTTSSIERINAMHAASVGANLSFSNCSYVSMAVGKQGLNNKKVNRISQKLLVYLRFGSCYLPIICRNAAPVLANKVMILMMVARFERLTAVVLNIIAILLDFVEKTWCFFKGKKSDECQFAEI